MPLFAIRTERTYLKERALTGGVMGILGAFVAGGRDSAVPAGCCTTMSEAVTSVENTEQNRSDEFEALAMPLARALYGTAFRMLGNSQRAEDIVQEAYVRAWEKFDHYQTGSNFKAWIFQILVFLCRNEVRTHRNRPVQGESVDQILHSLVSAESQETKSPTSDSPRADWTALYADSVDDEFKRALDNLDSDNRAVLILVSLAEFTYQECAEALDMPLGTVMSRLYRARKQLQDELQSYAAERGFLRTTREGGSK